MIADKIERTKYEQILNIKQAIYYLRVARAHCKMAWDLVDDPRLSMLNAHNLAIYDDAIQAAEAQLNAI